MPVVDSSTFIHRQDLEEVVRQAPGMFMPIADLVLPGVSVQKTKGQLVVIDQHNYTEDPGEEHVRKGELSEAKEVNARYSELDFETFDRSLQHTIPYRRIADMGDRVRLESEAAVFLDMKFKLRREKRVSDLIMNTTTWPLSGTTGFTVSTSWYASGGKPKTDVETAGQYLQVRGGNRGMAEGIMSINTFMRLLLLEDLVNDRRYVETPTMLLNDANRKAVAAQLGLQDVFVGGVIYNTKAEGVTKVLASCWPDNYVGIGNYSARFGMYRVGATYFNTATKGMRKIDSWDNQAKEGIVVRAGEDLGEEVHHSDLQTLIKIVP